MASYVDGISQAATAAAASSTSSTSSSSSSSSGSNSSSSVTLGKEEFLTLLVAQLQNQDPLNPSDPTEFTAQLAQFGQLEQMMNLNTSMESLITAEANSQILSTFSLIGKEVLVEGSAIQVEKQGDTTEIGYTLDNTASSLTILIKDDSGNTVRTLNATSLDTGTHSLTWDGKDDSGKDVKAGKYSLVLQAESATEGTSVAATTLVRTEVTGVDLSSSTTKLETPVGQFSLASVHGVYDKDQDSDEKAATATTSSSKATTTTGETSTTTSTLTDIATAITES
ncbi:MAG: hypothetical protein BWK76_02270 [Desulfobulbaceae bacterium A2]|nr:MAG: hypothetical protein BWK76_02270 [Desulfobulbaceae bacterium A2]